MERTIPTAEEPDAWADASPPSVVLAALEPMIALGPDLGLRSWNEAFVDAFAPECDLVVGLPLGGIVAATGLPGDLAKRVHDLDPATQEPLDLAFPPDGVFLRGLRARIMPAPVGDGILVAISTLPRHRTEAAAVEQCLAEYRDLYDNAPDMFASLDIASGDITRCNRTLARALALRPTEIVGRSWVGLHHPDARARATRTLETLLTTGEAQDDNSLLARADGTPVPVTLRMSATRDEEGRVSGARLIWRELTRKPVPMRPEATDAADGIPIGTFSLGCPELTLELDERAAAMLGAAPGRPAPRVMDRAGWLDHVHADDRDSVEEALEDIGGAASTSTCHVEFRVATEGTPERSVVLRGSPLPGPDGVTNAIHGVLVDLSDAHGQWVREGELRAAADRARSELQRRETVRLESLARLAGGVAHDLNNHLMMVQGRVELGRRSVGDPERALTQFDQIERAVTRSAGLTAQLLAYAGRGDARAPEEIDLSQLLTEFGSMLELAMAERARLVRELDPGTPRVRGDASQIGEVILNLLSNAAEATADPIADVCLRNTRQECDAEWIAEHGLDGQLQPGLYARVDVEDHGAGMSGDTVERMFDPFFTTKPTRHGMGLATAQGIVRRHGGVLLVESTPGDGTTVTMLLPAVADGERAEVELREPRQCVLVVEDEEGIREIAQETIRELGYEPLMAPDGPQGIALFREHAASLCCVLLDLTLPCVDGDAVLTEMAEIDVTVPVVICSGRVAEAGEKSRPNCLAFLHKPYRMEELERVLERAARSRK